ncbi:hypothetical protein Q8F55_007510 [Vanrija albida]|uniref:Uncharacterized protein n=1 Tax=Vanrija albida TaxID=181172 RepID=A0ABR3PUM4_9TREE
MPASYVSSDQRLTAATLKALPLQPAEPAWQTAAEASSSMVFCPKTPITPDASTYSPPRAYQCYCGKRVETGKGIYCSIDCARGDAFSSLTHIRGESMYSSVADTDTDPSRAPSVASIASNSDDWDASHYRRMNRADQRRGERRARRRAEDSASPISTDSNRAPSAASVLSPSRVPELVSSHSRNTSNASSIFSLSTASSLSRNPSTSSSRYGGNTASVAIDDAILEDECEELHANAFHEPASARSTLKANGGRPRMVPRSSAMTIGRDMHDVLDEILLMEQSFHVEEIEEKRPSTPINEPFVPVNSRPARTPSPVLRGRGSVIPPGAPNAPDRRSSVVQGRPPSVYAHQSSLSESHTALYLATASPVSAPKSGRHRRSASPNLSQRRSISFTPQNAGPALPRPLRNRFDSPGVTPVRLKHLTPNAHHPAMNNWRFPTHSSDDDTPTRQGFSSGVTVVPDLPLTTERRMLWEHGADVAPADLAPALFPATSSPGSPAFAPRSRRAVYIPDDFSPSPAPSERGGTFSPPDSALRLGALLGSGNDSDDDESGLMDVDDSERRSIGASTIREYGLAAPVPPFTQRGW